MKLEYDNRSGMAAPAVRRGTFKGRVRTRDVAIQFRAGIGFPGQVSKTHPALIEAWQLDVTNPPTFYGQACIANPATGTVRGFLTTDTAAVNSVGVTVRPFPFQQAVASNLYGSIPFGNLAIQGGVPVDILRMGAIFVPVFGQPVRGAPVFVWVAASSGGHTLGGFEAATSASTTALLPTKFIFNSPADSNGVCEIAYN